jgi:NAD(P)H-dependent FMN reductase
MADLVGFAGSLRAGSYNRALLAAAVEATPEGSSLDVLPIDDVPLYNADVENGEGIPQSVRLIKDRIAAADGLVIATPEYNGGVPGVAKNVIDWISRPSDDMKRVTYGKPVALIGATPGGLGTALSQAAWQQVLRSLRMRVFTLGGPFYVSSAAKSFDDEGRPGDELAERIAAYMAAFVASLG